MRVLRVELGNLRPAPFKEAFPEFEVQVVGCARDALIAIHARAFHAYVLEFWLIDWGGHSLCREIRKYDPFVPILFYAPPAVDRLKAQALRAGADGIFEKPAELSAMAQQLRTLLARAEAASLAARGPVEAALCRELELRNSREDAPGLLSASAQRELYTKSRHAFIQARGTAAEFDDCWRSVYGGVRAGAGGGFLRENAREPSARNVPA